MNPLIEAKDYHLPCETLTQARQVFYPTLSLSRLELFNLYLQTTLKIQIFSTIPKYITQYKHID